MATGQGNINTYTGSGYTLNWAVYVVYNVTSTTDTTVNYTVSVKIYHINTDTTKRVQLSSGVTASLKIAGTEVKTFLSSEAHTVFAGTENMWEIITYSGSFTRGTTDVVKSLEASVTLTNWGKGTSTYTNNSAFSVPRVIVKAYLKLNGAIKTAQVYIKANGAIYQPHSGYIKTGGVWKKIL